MREIEAKRADWAKVERKLKSSIKEAGLSRGEQARYDAYCIAFLKWVEKRSGKDLGYDDVAQKLMLECDIDKLAADAVEKAIKSCGWNKDSEPTAKKVFAEDALAAYVLANAPGFEKPTASNISSLALQILSVKPGESLVDLECGVGSFLSCAAAEVPEADLFGVDVDERCAAVCQMRLTVARSLLQADGIARPGTIRVASAFDDATLQMKYDKVFSNHPYGLTLDCVDGDSKLLVQLKRDAQPSSRRKSAEWAFCRALVESLKQSGRGVALMSGMSVTHPNAASDREWFVSNGWIEGVIALPIGSAADAMVVFSSGNASIRFIDASRASYLDDGLIERIVSAWRGAGEGKTLPSKTVPAGHLANHSFDLSPAKLMMEIRSGTSLKRLSGGQIKRGLLARWDEEASTVANDGDYLYLKLSDIADYKIGVPLTRLPEQERSRSIKLALKEGDLLIPRTGVPAKIAVVENISGRIVIPSDNIYTVTLDASEIDPWYAAAFLSSPAGANALKKAGTGLRTQIISLEALEDVEIPVIDMVEQKRIAAIWKRRTEHISEARRALNVAIDGLNDGLWD